MGFMSWIRGRKSGGTSTRVETHSVSVNLGSGPGSLMRDGVEVSDPAERQAIIDEVDQLTHRFLRSSAAAASDDVATTSSTTIIMDGRPVSADDPRARQKMLEAISKLRAQGLDDLADNIARQLGVMSGTASGIAQPASAADMPGAGSGWQVATGADTGAVGDDSPVEPTPPTPPTPPSPPSA